MCYPMGVQGLLSFAHMILPVMCISSGCKCHFIVYASCYESCLVSHDVSIYCMMELWTSLQYRYCILDIILLEMVFPFFLVTSSWCRCIRHIILNLELSSLVLRNKSHPYFLVGDYVCDLSYKSNELFVWLETFHKVYS